MTVQVDHEQCIKCVGCVGTCPYNALDYIGDKIVPDPKLCVDCNICVKFCPVNALSVPGKPLYSQSNPVSRV